MPKPWERYAKLMSGVDEAAFSDDPQSAVMARAQQPISEAVGNQIKEDYANRLTYQDIQSAVRGDKTAMAKVNEWSSGVAMGSMKEAEGVAKGAKRALSMSESARMARAKKMGFDPKNTYYHGTKANIEGFDPEALGASTNAPSARKGFFFAEDASTASDYADLSKGRATLRAKSKENELWNPVERAANDLKAKYGDNFKTPDEYIEYMGAYSNDELAQRGIKKVDPKDPLLKKYQDARKAAETETEILSLDPKKALENTLYDLKLHGPQPTGWTKTHLEDQKKNLQYWKDYLAAFDKPIETLTPGEQASRKFGKKPEEVQAFIDKISDRIKNWTSLKSAAEKSHYKKLLTMEGDVAKYKKLLNEETNGQNVLPVHLKMSNPYVHDYKGVGYREESYNDIIQKAKDAGHDSVLLKNTYDPADRENRVLQNIRVVFEPSQIRSKFAKFDPKQAKSGNLSAALAGVTVGGGALAGAGGSEAQASEPAGPWEKYQSRGAK